MRTHLRQLAVAAALTLGASAVAAVPAMAQQDENRKYTGQRDGSSQAQRTDPDTYATRPDYSNNDYYRTGNDEGYQDYQAKKQREKHEHQYKTDDDRSAHDYGYQEGWSGRSYHDNQNHRNNQTYGDNQRYRDNQNYRNNQTYGDNQRYRDNQNYRNKEDYRDNQNYRDNQKHDKDDDHEHDLH
jgi:hypothetical protein